MGAAAALAEEAEEFGNSEKVEELYGDIQETPSSKEAGENPLCVEPCVSSAEAEESMARMNENGDLQKGKLAWNLEIGANGQDHQPTHPGYLISAALKRLSEKALSH